MIKALMTFLITDPWAIPILYAAMVASWIYVRYSILDKGRATAISVFACLLPALFMFHPVARFLGGLSALAFTLFATCAIIYDRNDRIWEWFMEPIVPKLKKLWKDPTKDEHENPGY